MILISDLTGISGPYIFSLKNNRIILARNLTGLSGLFIFQSKKITE